MVVVVFVPFVQCWGVWEDGSFRGDYHFWFWEFLEIGGSAVGEFFGA